MFRMIKAYLCPMSRDKIEKFIDLENINGMTILEAEGYGLSDEESGTKEFSKRTELEIILKEEAVDPTIEKLQELTEAAGCPLGKIFVLPVEDAIRIETGERGIRAIR